MTSSKGLSYNEMRILWNSDRYLEFEGLNSFANFYVKSGDRMACVQDHAHFDTHDTFNSFWLVWGNWQEYKLVE
jgi:hypothetical protein